MIFFIILIYFLLGATGACLYNALTDVPTPSQMNEDQKRIMFLNTFFWPVMLLFYFVNESVKTVKWLIKKIKK